MENKYVKIVGGILVFILLFYVVIKILGWLTATIFTIVDVLLPVIAVILVGYVVYRLFFFKK
jgi:hypothetical protein